MGMVGADMADSIRSSMGFPLPVSSQLTGWASAVVAEVQMGIVNNAVVTGVTAAGGTLSNGASSGGIISGLSGSRLATAVASAAGYPSVSSQLTAFCTQIVLHVQTLGLVAFASGNITGNCTSTPLSPGPLVAGEGTNGMISGLSGSTLATAIHGAAGYPGSVSSKLTQFCTAIVAYIMANARVSYASGSVTGTCPPGGGSLSGGAALNGTIA